MGGGGFVLFVRRGVEEGFGVVFGFVVLVVGVFIIVVVVRVAV